MKKIFLLWFLLFCALCGWAQTDSITNNILTTKQFRSGLFIKFSQFKSNMPMINQGYTITEDSVNDWYRIVFDKGQKRQEVYAFSDGRFLYLNAKVYSEHANYFVKIVMLGPIVYFEDAIGKTNVIKNRVARGASFYAGITAAVVIRSLKLGPAKNPGWIIYLPDEDGEAYILDAKSLLSIFKEAKSELYDKLKADPLKDRFETQLNYLQLFNGKSLSN